MKSLRLALLLTLFTLVGNAHSAILGLNDVSVLMPLQNDLAHDSLFKADSVGKFGVALPKEIFYRLPRLLIVSDNYSTYQHLRAIGIRLDPCFPLPLPQVGCQAQLRIVWQPLEQNKASDVAAHTFYNLSANELLNLVNQIKNLNDEFKISLDKMPLNVHPILKEQGIDSPYGQKLYKILLQGMGESRLTRITFMQQTWLGNVWIFGGLDIKDGKVSEITIPHIPTTTQTFFNKFISTTKFEEAGMDPEMVGEDSLAPLLKSLNSEVEIVSSKKLQDFYQVATRIENPLIHSPQTHDCVSCHLAEPARLSAEEKFPATSFSMIPRFESKYDLTNTTNAPGKNKFLRSFGYVGAEPAVNQRVINETAHVLEQLEGK